MEQNECPEINQHRDVDFQQRCQDNLVGERIIFSTNGFTKTSYSDGKTISTKVISHWIRVLKRKKLNILEKKVGENLQDFWAGKILLRQQKALTIREKIMTY